MYLVAKERNITMRQILFISMVYFMSMSSVSAWENYRADPSNTASSISTLPATPATAYIVLPRGVASEAIFGSDGDGYIVVKARERYELCRFSTDKLKLIWRAPITDSISLLGPLTPAISEEAKLVIAVAFSGRVMAFDALTGKKQWQFDPTGSLPETTGQSKITAASAPKYYDGVIYYCGQGSVFALKAITGKLLWQKIIGGASTTSSPAIGSTAVFISNAEGTVALRRADGLVLWQNTSADGAYSPVLDEENGRLFVAGRHVTCISTESGNTTWKANWVDHEIEGLALAGASNVLLKEVRGPEGSMRILSGENGSLIWQSSLVDGPSQPCVSSNVILTVRLPKLIAFQIGRTEPLWVLPLGLGITSNSPSIGPGGLVAIHDGNNRLWIIRGSTAK